MFPLGKRKTSSSQSHKRGLTVLPLFLLIALLTVQFFLPIRSHLIDPSTLSTGDESQTTTNSTRSTVTIIIPPPIPSKELKNPATKPTSSNLMFFCIFVSKWF